MLVSGFAHGRVIVGYRIEGKTGEAGENEWIEAKVEEGEERHWKV